MRPNRDQVLMEVAKAYAQRSTCLRRQVGAVIGVDGRVLSSGYVGAPPGLPHCTPEVCSPEVPCTRTIHAEANAIAWAARTGTGTEGAVLYTTVSPCHDCAKLIIASGIRKVVFLSEYRDTEPLDFLEKAWVVVVKLYGPVS